MALPIDVLNLQRMSSCFLGEKNVRLFDEFIKIRLIKNKIYGITAKPGHFDKKKTQVLFMFVRLFKIDGGRIVITVLLKNLAYENNG